MARTVARPPRRKWPWILGALVVVIVVVVGAVNYYGTRTTDEPGTATTAPTSAPTATAGGADPVPTGCLGGEARDAAMVLAAQQAAPHTSNGAVEVATAVVRWAYQYPYPDPEGADQVAAAIVSSNAPANFGDLRGFFEKSPNLSGGLVSDGVDYYLSTVPGVWHLESYSGDAAEVSIGTGLVVDGELSTTLRTSVTASLSWEDGMWKVEGFGGTRTTEDMYSIGTQFTEGC